MNGAELAKLYYYHISENTPKEALRSMKYAGELQEKRLRKFGLARRIKYASGQGVIDGIKVAKCADDRYVSEMYCLDGNLTEVISRGGKEIYKESEDRLCYATVTDTKEGQLYGEDVYCCPNCGASAKIRDLENGCPYCGTHFEMAELFPKVSCAFTVKDFSEAGKEHSSVRPFLIGGMVLAVAVNLIRSLLAGSLSDAIFGIIFGLLGGALLGYVIWAILKLASVVKEGAGSASMLSAIGSDKKFEKIMSSYFPEYTYEYFTGIVTSLLQVLIFSDQDDKLPFYMGKENHHFEDVVSSSYRGAMKLMKCSVDDNLCTVSVKVFLNNIHYDGKKIHKKDETVFVTLQKDLRGKVNNLFAIHAINCRSCGGVFDAYRNHTCPFCGSTYELQDLDWVIVDLNA